MKKNIKIGFIGMGTVAKGVWKILSADKASFEKKFGSSFEFTKVALKNISKKRDIQIEAAIITTDPFEVVNDPEIDIVCELMGGEDLAKELTLKAIENGKTVISANKALICKYGQLIFQKALENKVGYFFEASVAGSIPIIKSIREGLIANKFERIYGILNGTSNYILTKMTNEGASFNDVLTEARNLGYVEADEGLDLDGFDAAHKLSILAFLAHGKWIGLDQMIIEGIRNISASDMLWAKENSYKIKLIGSVFKDENSGKIGASIYPSLISKNNIIANVDMSFNGICVEGDCVGESVYIGKGAGEFPTASAVVSDIADAIHFIQNKDESSLLSKLTIGSKITQDELISLDDIKSCFYIRMEVLDEAGVLEKIASIFAKNQISIESLIQRNSKSKSTSIMLTTHQTTRQAFANTIKLLSNLSFVEANICTMIILN